MSKLVVIIDDDEWVGCPLEHEGYCPIVWNEYYKGYETCDGVLNCRPEFCPLKSLPHIIDYEHAEDMRAKYSRMFNFNNTNNALVRFIDGWESALEEIGGERSAENEQSDIDN